MHCLFPSINNRCTEEDDTLVESHCVALAADGVHTAILLLNAHRAGSECRLSQADAAWVRNVIADSEHFLPDLLHEMP